MLRQLSRGCFILPSCSLPPRRHHHHPPSPITPSSGCVGGSRHFEAADPQKPAGRRRAAAVRVSGRGLRGGAAHLPARRAPARSPRRYRTARSSGRSGREPRRARGRRSRSSRRRRLPAAARLCAAAAAGGGGAPAGRLRRAALHHPRRWRAGRGGRATSDSGGHRSAAAGGRRAAPLSAERGGEGDTALPARPRGSFKPWAAAAAPPSPLRPRPAELRGRGGTSPALIGFLGVKGRGQPRVALRLCRATGFRHNR